MFLLISISAHTQCEDLEVEVIGVHPICYGFCDGAVLVDVIVAAFPADVSVKDFLGNEVDAGPGTEEYMLCDGWYYISVVDSLGCVFTDSVELINPDPVTFEFTVIDPSEPGLCDGFASVDTVYGFQGDDSEISIIWMPDGPAGIGAWFFEDMCANSYSIYISDAFGCVGIETYAAGSLVSMPNYLPLQLVFVSKNGGYRIESSENETLIMKIYNVQGQLVKILPLNRGTTYLQADDLKGIHLYQITNLSGKVLTGKLSF